MFSAIKSVSLANKIDICIIISIFLLLICPIIYGLFSKISANVRQKDIYVSSRFEEIFGKEITQTILNDFTEQNPDIRIKLIDAEASGEADNSKTAKKAPSIDILIFDEGDYSALASGALLPLAAPDAESEQLAVPLVSFMDLLFYNIELLDTAGFDRPPKTREEFLSFAKTVSNGEEASGAAMSLSDKDRHAVSRDIFSWIWAGGGDFWPKENASGDQDEDAVPRPVINTRALVRDISFFGSLYREGSLSPEVFDTTGEQRLQEFAQGKIAMIVSSTSAIASLREKMGDGAFGITVIPGSGSALRYSVGLSGIYAGINAECANPEEARIFLDFLAEKSPLLCAELKAVPGIASDLFSGDYLKDDPLKDDPFYSKARSIFEASEIVQGFSKTTAAKEFEDAVRDELRIFFENTRTPEETAAAIQKRWDEIQR